MYDELNRNINAEVKRRVDKERPEKRKIELKEIEVKMKVATKKKVFEESMKKDKADLHNFKILQDKLAKSEHRVKALESVIKAQQEKLRSVQTDILVTDKRNSGFGAAETFEPKNRLTPLMNVRMKQQTFTEAEDPNKRPITTKKQIIGQINQIRKRNLSNLNFRSMLNGKKPDERDLTEDNFEHLKEMSQIVRNIIE